MSDNISEDENILLRIFPEEIWQRIFQNCHLADEYTRIANSSKVFKNSMLPPHWNRVVYPKIITLLDDSVGYHTPEGQKTLLNLRRVCRAWKLVVDNFLDNLPEQFFLSFELAKWRHHRDDPRRKLRCLDRESLQSCRSVTGFRETFDASHLPQKLNPFVGRELRIGVTLGHRNFSGYIQAILDLLRDYGAHVKYLWLHIAFENRNQLELVNFGRGEWIKDILLLLPSLRTMCFWAPMKLNCHLQSPDRREAFSEMKEYWKQNSMPNLPNLTMIWEFGMPMPVLLSALRANPQLRILESKASFGFTTTPNRQAKMFKNIRELSVTFKYGLELECFLTSQLDSKLTKLYIDARHANIEWTNLMALLERKFGKTLRHVYVSTRKDFGIPLPPLKMPNLETLHLAVMSLVPERDLDFLSSVGATLKTLYVEVDWDEDTFSNSKEYYRQRLVPRQSDLWRLLPALQKFSVLLQHGRGSFRWHNGTRDQWKEYQEVETLG